MLIVLLFTIFFTAEGGPPRIQSFTGPSFNRVPFQLGDLTLQCTAAGNPKPVVSFVRNGTRLVQGAGVLIRRNSITLKRVDYKRDNGLYQCLAINNDAGILSEELNFQIRVLGEFLQPNRIIDPVKFVDVTVGRPVEIRCPPYTYTHPANFLWGSIPASGAPVVLHTTGRRYVLSNGNLFYSFMEDSDLTEVNTRLSGVSCILYILGKYRPSVKIQFRKQGALTSDFAPTFRERLPLSVSVGIGKAYTFFCAVAGKPLPTISWYFKNQIIRTDTPGLVISPTGHKLTLTTIARSSAGLYYCQVQNRLGTVRSDTTLKVEFPPARNRGLVDVKSRPNVDIKLNCTAASGALPISYRWFKNGGIIFTSLTYKVTAGLLVIKDANVSATGVYQCMARNLYGNKLSSSFVDVKEGYSPSDSGGAFSWEVIVAVTFGGVAFLVLLSVGAYYTFKRA